ncbi:MAG: 23S rRNA (pseudouridine(1915)-N(3))-methyltransferase RlmH [Clostridia bacterium]|nr:23S rRNA (pseudouridine(1915)-N(3))-methyltransferase RlmH [Clostridia bacterium]
MQSVTIIAVGSLKEKYLRDAMAEYSKRLSAFCKFNVIEIAPVRIPESPSQGEISSALQKEGAAILSKIPRGAQTVAMCIEGKQQSSERLAQTISNNAGNFGSIVFIIGGSHGLCDEVKKKSNIRLSMSEMTFPHQLARVMLTEQIYRAFMINSNNKYHK